jgi:hypothetical protein
LIYSNERLARLMDENGKGGAGQEKTPPFANIKSAEVAFRLCFRE